MERVDLFATPIMPARAVEYAAAFLSTPAGIAMAGEYPAAVRAVGVLGLPCAGAASLDACNQTLAMLSAPSDACVENKLCTPFVVTTQGSAARRIDTEQELVDWLGIIDTPSEAVFVAMFKGLTPSCEGLAGSVFYVGRGTMVLEQPDGYVVRSEWQTCDNPELRETVKIAPDGSSGALERIEIGPERCTSGRRPAGLRPTAAIACEPAHAPGLQLSAACAAEREAIRVVGAFLAQAATLEAASVYAFQQLARELVEHAAPAELIVWAARSALEEVRHTQLMAAQAQRYGATPAAPQIAPHGVRSLFELALENAVEGCIRETYGALVAHQQATLAHDPQLADVMSSIARDEASHAELSWRIAAWVEPQLNVSERAQLTSARRAALAELYEAANIAVLPTRAALTLGYPSPALEHATLNQLRDICAIA
jgi:hypothetical protein